MERLIVLLPRRVAQMLRLGSPRIAASTSPRTNTFLTCWLAFPSNSVTSAWASGSGPMIWVGDENGNFAGDNVAERGMGLMRNGKFWCMRRADILPRRSQWLRIVVFDSEWAGNRVGEFRVQNPLFDAVTAPFGSAPLPQTASDGDLEFRLEDLYLQASRPADMTPPPSRGRDSLPMDARFEFTVRERGQPSTNWVSYHVTSVSDASGNQGDGNSWDHGFEGDRTYVEFSQYPLPAGEPWLAQVEFCQQSGFPANEVWSLRKIPISAGFEALRTNLHGATISVSQLILDAQARNRYDNSSNVLIPVVLTVLADRPPDTNRWHLTIARAVDDLGRDVTANSFSGSDDRRDFRFSVSAGAKALDVDIAFVPSRQVWFTAQPKVRAKP